jgi:hypothetical protein
MHHCLAQNINHVVSMLSLTENISFNLCKDQEAWQMCLRIERAKNFVSHFGNFQRKNILNVFKISKAEKTFSEFSAKKNIFNLLKDINAIKKFGIVGKKTF